MLLETKFAYHDSEAKCSTSSAYNLVENVLNMNLRENFNRLMRGELEFVPGTKFCGLLKVW